MNNQSITHTFVVCAYKESPYLEDCIKSLLDQTQKTDIIIETSTPNDYIKGIADKYSIDIYVNNGESGCANDWNYGYNQANTTLVTIAHQDDIYFEDYAKTVIDSYKDGTLLLYTDYVEIRRDEHVANNTNLNIKRKMNYLIQKHPMSIRWRRFVLSFGDSISCPAVTFNKNLLGNNVFQTKYKCSVDYDTWETLSKKTGLFIYIPKLLMGHRIYEESSTTKFLANNTRQKEDYEILKRFWPKPIAKFFYFFYKKSQDSNKVKK